MYTIKVGNMVIEKQEKILLKDLAKELEEQLKMQMDSFENK